MAVASCWIIASGQRVPLAVGENLVGRVPEAALQLDHASVSRRHARITVGAWGAVVEDLGSKNGTRVDNHAVRTPVSLQNGARIAFGQVSVTYRRASPELSTATQASRTAEPSARQ